MYCGGRQDDRNMVQAAMGVGAIFGVIMVNILGTFMGKLLGLRVALAMGCIQSYLFVGGAYAKQVWMLVAGSFMGGASHMALVVFVMLMLRKFGTNFIRTRVAVTYGLFNTSLAVAILALISPQWQTTTYFMVFGSTAVLVLSFWAVMEDPNYLFHTQRMKELEQTYRQIAEMNEATESEFDQAMLQVKNLEGVSTEHVPNSQVRPSRWSLLTCSVLIQLLILSCYDLVHNAVYVGFGYQIKQFKMDPLTIQLIIGVADVVSLLLLFILVRPVYDWLGVKRSIVVVGACFAVYCAVFLTPLPSSSLVSLAVLLLLFRFSYMAYFAVYVQLWTTSFPPPIENLCLAVVTVFGSLGKVLGPLAIRLSEDNQINPFVLWIITIIILGVIPSVFLRSDQEV